MKHYEYGTPVDIFDRDPEKVRWEIEKLNKLDNRLYWTALGVGYGAIFLFGLAIGTVLAHV